MTDVDELVRRLTEPPPATAAALAPARDQLLAGMRPRRRGRIAAAAVLAAGVAAGFTVFAVVTTTPQGSAPPPSSAAAEVLTRAAAAARQQPDVVPRPDQFVYTESRSAGGVSRTWLSADGTRDGLVEGNGESLTIPGCRSAPTLAPGDKPEPPANGCGAGGAYQPDLPTTKAGMLAHLTEGTGSTNVIGKKGLGIAGQSWLRPASRAALYEALTDVPGLEVVQDARDAAGRSGIGITWTNGARMTMVFDRTTYRFLGTPFDAVVAQAIVDRAGERP